MNMKPVISASALVIAMSFASPLAAQSQEPTPQDTQQLSIGGVPVPADQLLAIQTRCDELLAQERAVAATDPDTATPAADAPAAGASDDLATTESSAEEPVVDPTTTGTVESDAAANGNLAADTESAGDARIDIAMITVEQCQEGGFTTPTP